MAIGTVQATPEDSAAVAAQRDAVRSLVQPAARGLARFARSLARAVPWGRYLFPPLPPGRFVPVHLLRQVVPLRTVRGRGRVRN